jgi:phospholipid/cholesterol/gamma-HCH transport system substrate-binding protein
VDFAFAGGLPAGAAVKIAGVKVGRIRAVEFRPEARDEAGEPLPVHLTVEIDREAAGALRTDTSATVGQQGALGESYLEVLLGHAPGQLAENASVRGIDPPRLDVLLAKLFKVFEGAATDEAFRRFLVAVGKLAGTLDDLLNANRGEIIALFQDLASTLGDARDALKDVKGAAHSASTLLEGPELKGIVNDMSTAAKSAREDLPSLLTEARGLVKSLSTTAGALGPDDVVKVKATIAKLDALATSLQKVSSSADAILTALDKGEGTGGKLLKDPKVYDDLRALLADLKSHPWKMVWKE